MELEAQPVVPAAVAVRRTWRWGKRGSVQEWGVILRAANGAQHVVTAATPEAVGAAVTAHLRSLDVPLEAAA